MPSPTALQRQAATLRAQDQDAWERWRRWGPAARPSGSAPPAPPDADLAWLHEEGQRLLAAGVGLARDAVRGRVDPAAHERLRAALRALRAALRRRRGEPSPMPEERRSRGPSQA
jgi:hypothetical protein